VEESGKPFIWHPTLVDWNSSSESLCLLTIFLFLFREGERAENNEIGIRSDKLKGSSSSDPTKREIDIQKESNIHSLQH
jgi:hypothetical protein